MVAKKKPAKGTRRASALRKQKTDNPPQYNLKMRLNDEKVKYRPSTVLGVGWDNTKGGISIKLNPGVIISYRDCEDHYLTLWPIDD